MGFLFSKAHQDAPATPATTATPATPTVTPATPASSSTVCTSSTIPAYTEDVNYHGHGGRVFVQSGVCVPSGWQLDTSVTAPAGKTAFYVPPNLMEQLYLQNLYSPVVVPTVGGMTPFVGYNNL